MEQRFDITPAPGYILVAPDKKNTSVGEIELAVKSSEYHEGTVLAIGPVPDHLKSLDMAIGDKVIYARYSTVEAILPGSGNGRLVGVHDIKGVRHTGSFISRILRKLVS